EHVEQRDRIEARPRESRIFERHGAKIETAASPELDRRGVQVDTRCAPTAIARRLDDKTRAASDIEVAHRLAAALRQMLLHDADALDAEPTHPVFMAADPKVANDLLVFSRRVDAVVMVLVKRWIDVHEIAHIAANHRHVVLRQLRFLRVGGTRRTGARRQQFIGDFAEPRDQRVNRMCPLLDERFVRRARTQLRDVDGLIFGEVPIRNLHSIVRRARLRQASDPTAYPRRATLPDSYQAATTVVRTTNLP